MLQTVLFATEKDELIKKRLETYEKLLIDIENEDIQKKINCINCYFNQMMPKFDKHVWKKDDYWANPREFVTVGQGDSEDYALAKYCTLKKIGFDKSKLFLFIVKEKNRKNFRMVLGYYQDNEQSPLILDNKSWKVMPLRNRTDMIFVLAFNEQEIIERKRRDIRDSDYEKYGVMRTWRDYRERNGV